MDDLMLMMMWPSAACAQVDERNEWELVMRLLCGPLAPLLRCSRLSPHELVWETRSERSAAPLPDIQTLN
jgi:hypothetical protein